MGKIRKICSLFFIVFIFHNGIYSQGNDHAISVIGTGYVGLVTGACLAHFGHRVTCVDIDTIKISQLQKGIVSIYEPDLETIIHNAYIQKKLSFTTDAVTTIKQADVVFIAVDTPMNTDGTAYMGYLNAVLKTIAESITKKTIICIKSTVPIGTTDYAEKLLLSYGISHDLFEIAMMPEFLREGTAVHDFLHPDRIVIGSYSSEAAAVIKEIHMPLLAHNVPCIVVDTTTAETIKYASNSFLAVKISFINEIANLCEKTGADICAVSYAMGLDKRVGPHFLKHGPGFGGSCFPKDCNALVHIAKQYGVTLNTLIACLQTNQIQRTIPVQKLLALLPDIETKCIAVLGLSFKAGTNDIRNSCAITTIELLNKHGATIKAYDPVANENMSKLFPQITYCDNLESALENVDAAILMTDWPEFKKIETETCVKRMRQPIIIDACNILSCKNSFLENVLISKIGKKL